MEFGRVSSDQLGTIDFSLPADSPETAKVLASAGGKKTEIYIGCAKWGRKDWIGKIYPSKTKEADFLSLYAKNFNAIELNATFYKLPSYAQTSAWSGLVV
jgi:hypothetical protein